MILYFILLLGIGIAECNTIPNIDDHLQMFLEDVNKNLRILYHKKQSLEHCMEIEGHMNDTMLETLEQTEAAIFDTIRSLKPALSKFKRANILDESLKRQLKFLPDLHNGVLNAEDSKAIDEAIANLRQHKNTLKEYCGISQLQGGQVEAKNLKDCWLKKTQELSSLTRDDWKTWIALEKKTSNFHGFAHPSDYWFRNLEMPQEEIMAKLYKFLTELWPIFEHYHAHIRHQLREMYGEENVPSNEPIPYHLYDSYVYNTWEAIDLPFPTAPKRLVTEGLKQRGLNNPKRAFLNIAEFYRSIGFPYLNQDFWEKYTNVAKNSPNCTCKVWNFFQDDIVKLTNCHDINEQHFYQLFENVFEIHFYKAVQKLPVVFQIEPFPQFIDGLSKAFSLNAASPKYLEKLTIFEEGQINNETIINYLFELGFRTLLPMPMVYISERIRAAALDSKTDTNLNCLYWELVEENVGLKPPLNRTDDQMDYAEKLLVDVDNELASSVFSTLLRFQVFKHFCETTKQYSKGSASQPLYMCDLSNHPEIGSQLLKGLSLGASKSYKDVLKEITGETEISTEGIIEYFKPLYQWFMDNNDINKVALGWQRVGVCSTARR